MAMAMTLRDYLNTEGVEFDVVEHAYSSNATQAAEYAHVSGEKIAKGVVLQDDEGYVMAVIPATHRVQLSKLRKDFNRYLSLAAEVDLSLLFNDCTVGAVPPVGKAYDVDVIFDDRLNDFSDIYFEAGSHAELVHVSGEDFRQLIGDVAHGRISQHI